MKVARRAACLAGALAAHAALAACSDLDGLAAERARASLTYGEDQRQDVHEVGDARLVEAALRSSVALIPAASLRRQPGGDLLIVAVSSGELYGLCASERFSQQPAAAECSGVLIGDSLVLTAGHCAERLPCAEQAWVFGYAITAPGGQPHVGDDNVYRCQTVVTSAHVRTSDGKRWDHAVIALDRRVVAPRRPARLGVAPEAGDRVAVVGYPLGVPAKVDPGATVLATRPAPRDYFTLDSDTYDRSSGSGVFDANAELVGLLVRGGQDFERRDGEDCVVSRVLPSGAELGEAEQASYAATAVAGLCASGWRDDALCASFASPEVAANPGCAVAGQPRGVTWTGLVALALAALSVRCFPRRCRRECAVTPSAYPAMPERQPVALRRSHGDRERGGDQHEAARITRGA